MTLDSSKVGGPDGKIFIFIYLIIAGFTQRAVIDEELNELFVLSGLMREKHTNQETFKNRYLLFKN